MEKMKRKNQGGFTLIELMIVIAIIGILAAIAIPQFTAYKNSAFNAAAMDDLKIAAIAQEAYFADEFTYTNSTSLLISPTYGLFLTDGVQLVIVSATNTTYSMKSWHSSSNSSFILRGPGGSISQY